MAKIFDPHEHERYYDANKDKALDGISAINSKLILSYVQDMETGKNVSPSSKKGSRGFSRLVNLKSKLRTLTRLLEKKHGSKMTLSNLDSDKITEFFDDMRKGRLKKERTNKPFKDIGTYVKTFKAFWHWHQRCERKQGKDIPDITIDLDGSSAKPEFIYLKIEQVKKLCDHAKYDYKVLMMFLFDSGIRAPKELQNVRVSDLEFKEDHCMLNIREETSKTFGRKIKLLLCSSLLKEYIKDKKLSEKDFLFTTNYKKMNVYLSRLAFRILGIGEENENNISKGLTLYDFRHSSACYWLPRYKNESILKYRFGWKKSEMIFYYTEFLGLKDTIQEEDLYIDVTKTQLENEISKGRKEQEIMREQISQMQQQIKKMMLATWKARKNKD